VKLLHTQVAAGPQNIVEVFLSRPNANVVLLDDANWWLYQRGQVYQPQAGGFFQATNTVRLRAPIQANWHLVVDLGGQPGDITATYRVVMG
jgi:hypothetical protein